MKRHVIMKCQLICNCYISKNQCILWFVKLMYIFQYLQTSQQGLICTSQMQHKQEAADKKIKISIT